MELTELPVANASLLDEATSAAEAVQMSYNVHNGKKNKYFVSESLFPQTIDVIKTKAHALGINLEIGNTKDFNFAREDIKSFCGLMVQNPDNFGTLTDFTDLGKTVKDNGMVFTIVADILSNTIIKSPGAMGADIACGSAQRFGIPFGYGGPHPGYFASTDKLKRKLPGRIIGISKDSNGD